jgi:hypothetical protein
MMSATIVHELTNNTTNIIVAVCAVVGVLVSSTASVTALFISKETKRKITTPGEGSGTIGEQVERINPRA